MDLIDDPERLAACLAVAGDWLAVGLDARPDRWAAFPWRRAAPPTLAELAGELADRGVRRVVLGHAASGPGLDLVAELASRGDVDVVVAGGVTDLSAVRALRDRGVTGIILGEALLSGAVDFIAALEAAA
jgi:phosphoribosylformimino-5-aminoimidazole carboxamide ribotide isomerase